MAKCYHCGRVLSDAWIIKQGASLMGQTGGKKKSRKDARKAAMARWDRAKNRTPRE